MTEAVAIIGLTPSAQTPAPSVGAQGSVAPSSVPVAEAIQSQRLVVDPTVGFITQYVSSRSGDVLSQYPSETVVAYLRNGLTAEGLPKASGQSFEPHTTQTIA